MDWSIFNPSAPFIEKHTSRLDTNEASTAAVNHNLWQQTLDEYLITGHSSGINRLDYETLQNDGTEEQQYLAQLAATDPRTYNRAEQFAFWVNLYNALTIKLLVDNYPVELITKLGCALIFGPWDDELIEAYTGAIEYHYDWQLNSD